MSGRKEIFRQLIHVIFGCSIILATIIIQRGILLRILFLLFLIIALISFLHLKFKFKILQSLAREQESKFPLRGLIFFIVGAILVILIFKQDIALASLTVLTFGDSTSTLAGFIGMKYRINPFRKFKSIFGSFCGFVVAFIFSLIFVSPMAALVGAFFGMFSEAISIKLGETDADDNLIVPLAAGTAIYLLRYL